ncbi:MAG: universal stress protein [Vicinamibacterales bacterium]
MRPGTTILVPLDFSKASHSALRYACQLADRLRASLHVLHVVQPPAMPTGYVEAYVATPDVLERFEAEGHQLLNEALTPEEQARYHAALIQRTGDPASEILRYVTAHGNIDLIVIATHGRGGVARLMMGSVADRLVRAAPCPVLTLRDPVEHARPAAPAA